jgi:TIR domain
VAEVFVAYAQKDRDAVVPIIEAIRRAKLSVWHSGMMTPGEDWDEQIAHQIKTAKSTVFVWSNAAVQSEFLQQEIRAAVQAWSSDRLALATLDDTPLPVGLRDLSPISLRDASGTEQLIERVVRNTGASRAEAQLAAPSSSAKWGWRVLRIVAGLFVGLFILVTVFVWFDFSRWGDAELIGRIDRLEGKLITRDAPPPKSSQTPLPNTPPPTSETVMGFSTPAALASMLILGAVIGAVAVFLWNARSKRKSSLVQLANVTAALVDPRAVDLGASSVSRVFVSYSRQDARTVEQLVKQIEELGYTVWIDRQLTGSQRYAGPIVTAIRHSRLVALMCSQNAFASDHVIREVYLAGDYKKPFIVFQLDSTEFPDELRYFVSGFPCVPVATVDLQQLRSQIAKLIAA